MFKFPHTDAEGTVNITIDGKPLQVPARCTVAAALLCSGYTATRSTAISNTPRAPLCMMGVCYECLMIIDGQPNRRACQQTVHEGMRIERQQGSGPAP